jgi:hypothetical protein
MYTSLLLFALSAYSAQPTFISPGPRWYEDYGIAYQCGQKEKKPLAVFVAKGPDGWDRLSREGRLGKEIEQILRSNYVCVYLDASKEKNQRLASSFDLAENRGLILSDRTGSKQAFRAEAKLSNEDLARSLKKFADPDVAVTVTETPYRAPVYAPAFAPAPAVRVQGC